MKAKNKRMLKKAARAGVSGVGRLIATALKVIGTVLLILIVTGTIFAVIFVSYIKTNLMDSDKLEVSLEAYRLNLSSTIYYQEKSSGQWKELVTLESTENRVWVPYEEIPIDLEHAVVSIEDQRFYTHHGVDWYRTAGAFVNMFVGMKNNFGGSTITQQLIKNVTNEDEATVQRKLKEIFRAIEFEKRYDKKDIIEAYLNRAFFGHGRYGIGAAADLYFGKDVSKLTLAEMCSIVGITNNPSIYSPYVSIENNKRRQEIILGKMEELGYIDHETCLAAKAEELHFQPFRQSLNTGVTVYSYYVDTVIRDVRDYLMKERGISEWDANFLLYHGGLSIYSCIDMDIQDKVDSIYQNLENFDRPSASGKQLQSAIVIQNPYTGDIVALTGGVGTDKAAGGLNRAAGKLARRPTGSSIKPLSVYGPAMDSGLLTLDTTYEDEPDIKLLGTTWYPKNADRKYSGVITVRYAIQQSKNTVAAQVLDQLTLEVSYDFLKNKVNFESLEPEDMVYSALALGQQTYGITPREMAAGFSVFVNNGVFTEGRTFSRIYDSEGALIYNNIPESKAVFQNESTAYWMTDVMKEVMTVGTGTSAKLSNMPCAGKTGSTTSNNDRWFVGYTPYYVCAVWTGYDIPEAIPTKGGSPANTVWKQVMELVHEDLPRKEFTVPSDTEQRYVPGVGAAVPYYSRGILLYPDGGFEVLYSEEVGKHAAGREVTVTAKELEGYTLTSEKTVTITLDAYLSDNTAEFIYVSDAPPEPEYTIIYTDGAYDEVIFEDQNYYGLHAGDPTPSFTGSLHREGYVFTGWYPELSDTVTDTEVYSAQWAPIQPDEPDVPEVPDVPDNPDNPDEPVDPDEPEVPDNPDEPVTPAEPDNPDEPEEPVEPTPPDEPPEEPELPSDEE